MYNIGCNNKETIVMEVIDEKGKENYQFHFVIDDAVECYSRD